MPPAQDTKTHIILAAITVLKVQGTEGLTMRKVATQARMSLGNLQYHFRDKPALMAGLAEHYFGECEGMLDGYQHAPPKGTDSEKLRRLILFLLDHVDHISDMCRIFREIWALSARDAEIHGQLLRYYQVSLEKLTTLLEPLSGNRQTAGTTASLLLPYLEGYSITCEALAQTKKEVAEMLVRLCLTLHEERP